VAGIELLHVHGGIACALDFIGRCVLIQHELARHDADQHQHHQTNPFLAVVGAMDKAHAHGRCDQRQARPEWGVFLAVAMLALFRRFVHARRGAVAFERQQKQTGHDETDGRRNNQREHDVNRFFPVHAIGDRQAMNPGIGQSHPKNRANQSVRA